MLIIGEKINVMLKQIGQAMKDRDKKPIQDLAVSQVQAGAGALDINAGPATKNGPEIMQWLVNTVQEVTDVPLSLDTTNAQAMEAGLQVCKNPAIINSTSGDRAKLETVMPMAKKYDAEVIGLTMTSAGVSRDANERVAIAVDIMTAMAEFDVPVERLYLDPLILPVGVAQNQAMEVVEAIKMFRQLNDPPLKSVVGLSNVYNGTPERLHSILSSTYLAMLMTVGLDAAIADPMDQKLMETMKTARLFKNDILYCDSYLE